MPEDLPGGERVERPNDQPARLPEKSAAPPSTPSDGGLGPTNADLAADPAAVPEDPARRAALVASLLRQPEVGEFAGEAARQEAFTADLARAAAAASRAGGGGRHGRRRRLLLRVGAVAIFAVLAASAAFVALRLNSPSGADPAATSTSSPSASASAVMPADVAAASLRASLGSPVPSVTASSAPSPSASPSASPPTSPSPSPTASASPSPSASPSRPSGGPSPSTGPRPSGPISPSDGLLVFSDDFASPANWPTGSPTSMTSLSYAAGRYVISATGSGVDHLIAAPVTDAYPSIVTSVTASQSSGRGTAGFGVTCQGTASSGAGSGASPTPTSPVSPSAVSPSPAPTSSDAVEPHLMYEFLVLSNGSWVVERRDGSPSKALPPVVLAHGPSPAVPGTAGVTVSGVCASAADGKGVRLILFVDAVRLADITDARAPQDGWRPGMVVTTIDVAAVVSVRHFEERQLP